MGNLKFELFDKKIFYKSFKTIRASPKVRKERLHLLPEAQFLIKSELKLKLNRSTDNLNCSTLIFFLQQSYCESN